MEYPQELGLEPHNNSPGQGINQGKRIKLGTPGAYSFFMIWKKFIIPHQNLPVSIII